MPVLAKQNKEEEIICLLQNGADVNEQDSDGITALYYACYFNNTELVEILLKHDNINVNLQDTDGSSPFTFACGDYRYECALMMLQRRKSRCQYGLMNGECHL